MAKKKSPLPFLRVITLKVVANVGTEFLEWMKETHIPEMYASGCFYSNLSTELIDTETELGFWIMQFTHRFKGKKSLTRYEEEFAPVLKVSFSARWAKEVRENSIVLQCKMHGSLKPIVLKKTNVSYVSGSGSEAEMLG